MNAMEKLGSEIRRVTELRGQYEETGRMFPGGNINVAPVIFMIDHALKRAIEANGSNDPGAVVSSLKELEEFTE